MQGGVIPSSSLLMMAEVMRIKQENYKLILDRYGPQHLGYYIALKMEGPLPLAKMATRCKLGTRVCTQIEQDLVELGLLKIIGKGLHRTIIDDTNPEIKDLINHLAEETGCDSNVSSWFYRHEATAREVIQDYGLDACKWMVSYVVRVKKLDMYSLRLLHSLAGELLPKYQQQKERRKLAYEANPPEWKEPSHQEEVRDAIAPEEVSGLLNFGIML